MSVRRRMGCDRRQFLGMAGCLLAGPALAGPTSKRKKSRGPARRRARATSGDVHEPDWGERLTVTVGPQGADLNGADDKVDPGRRRLRGPARRRHGPDPARHVPDAQLGLPPHARPPQGERSRHGAGQGTVADHQAPRRRRLVRPGDHAGRRHGFPGRRRRLPAGPRTRDNGGPSCSSGRWWPAPANRFKLDRALRENFWLAGKPTACRALSDPVAGENVTDLVIENLTLDGNKANNENLDGNYAGCIFLQDCSRVAIRRVDRPQLERRRHQLAGLPRRDRRGLPQPRPCRPGAAPRLGLAAADHPRQSRRAERDRHLLLLGRAVRPGRAEYDRREPQLRASRSATATPTT